MFFSNVNSFFYLTLAVLHCQLISKISRIFVAYQVQYLNPLSVRIRAKISPSGSAAIIRIADANQDAAAAGGIFARSTSSSLRVLATAPISAAATARRTGLLNIMENPNTPQKLARIRNKIHCSVDNDSFIKSTGFRCRIRAMIHADIVATRMTIKAYIRRSIPERISSLARSIPLVMNGNPKQYFSEFEHTCICKIRQGYRGYNT